MAFPSSPTNGQTTTINGITYVYTSADGTWSIQSSSSTTPSVTSGNFSITGNITATANITATGNLSGTLVAGTLTTAAQPNITSTGTLSSLTVTANANVGNVYATSAVYTPSLANGNTSVSITANANIGISVTSTSVGTVSTSGLQINSFGVGTAPSGVSGEIRATGNVTAGYSDIRLKDNIEPIESALDKIESLTGFYYTQSKLAEDFGYNNYERQVGVSAQAVQSVLPETVKIAPFDADSSGNSRSGDNYLTVSYERLIPLLIEGIKELRAELELIKRKQ